MPSDHVIVWPGRLTRLLSQISRRLPTRPIRWITSLAFGPPNRPGLAGT
jgi:hypothetical protein